MTARTALLLCLALAGCKREEPVSGARGSAARPPAGKDAVTLLVAYGSEKKTWLEEQARKFQEGGATTPSGRPIAIKTQALGSGEATQAILDGSLKPHVFSPASGVYLTLLNDAWRSQGGRTKPIAPWW